MFINDLPDDCLLIIFGLIDVLDDLINCYKVCNKWRDLIKERTRKVKYFIEHHVQPQDERFPSYPFDYVYYRTEEPIDGTCLSTLFPNLMIANFPEEFRKKVKHEDIATLVSKIKSFKGLIRHFNDRDRLDFPNCDELEMVSVYYMEPFIKKNGVNIKQLHLNNYTLNRFMKNAYYFPNLERLSIHHIKGWSDYYKGPVLRRLKIVEFAASPNGITEKYYGFQFMDSCPNLQSAHIFLTSKRIFVDESLKQKTLQDLVLQFFLPKSNTIRDVHH